MSIARESMLILLFLLPGVLFFVGLYIPEQFSRDVVARNGVFEIASIVLAAIVSYVLVFLLWLAVWLVLGGKIPAPTNDIMDNAIRSFEIAADGVPNSAEDALWLARHFLTGISLVAGASVIGLGLGWFVGHALQSGKYGMRRFVRHAWVYDLSVGYTNVFVMSNITKNECVVVYRGVLGQFGLQSDGCFSYLTIKFCERALIDVGLETPGDHHDWHPIGQSHGPHRTGIVARPGSGFVVRGAEMSNVVFEHPLSLSVGLENVLKARRVVVHPSAVAMRVAAPSPTTHTSPPNGAR